MSDTLNKTLNDDIDQMDLTCPGCGADLLADETYDQWRVCGTCQRHFWISARERIQLTGRFGSFAELPYSEPKIDAIEQHERFTAADRQEDARDRSALADAVVTGQALFDATPAIVAILDPALLPSGLGIVTADKLIAAIRVAISRRLPMIVICGGGSNAGSAGLLGAAQSLRISGAIAELHKAALPLIAVMTHPTGGNLLTALASNADLRLIEPGTAKPDSIETDARVSRQDLNRMLTALLAVLRGDSGPTVALGDSPGGVVTGLRTILSHSVVEIAIDSDSSTGIQDWHLVARAMRIADHLELPVIIRVSGARSLDLPVQTELRDILLRHRRPVIAVCGKSVSSSHLALLAVDVVIAEPDLQIPGQRSKFYSAGEAKSAGVVDVLAARDIDELIGSSLNTLLRMSPSRRLDQRLRLIDARGAELPESHEAAHLEMLDLKVLQSNFKRSVDDWRHKFEQREFSLPKMANFQPRPTFRPPSFPRMNRPDLIEMRNKWLARMRAPSEPRDSE